MKAFRYVAMIIALAIPVAAVASSASSADCCKPGAACCESGHCPFCSHAK